MTRNLSRDESPRSHCWCQQKRKQKSMPQTRLLTVFWLHLPCQKQQQQQQHSGLSRQIFLYKEGERA